VLARHPAVGDVAVLGRPDPTWGEAVHAVIIPVAGQAVSADGVIAWCRDQLAHFKCPKSVEFASALPRTTTGKVLKRELRARLSASAQSPSAQSPSAQSPSAQSPSAQTGQARP
jgi:fatty-acyl-CoA synthase